MIDMNIPPLGLQLYSLRHEFTKDPQAALASISALGFRTIETAGDYGWSADTWRELLDRHGLQVVSAHLPLTRLETEFEALLSFQQALGNSNLIVPSLPPELRGTTTAFQEAAKRLMRLAEIAHQAGAFLLYHNHAFEFAHLDDDSGRCGMEVLMAETDPDLVAFQFDTYYLHRGGHDAADWLHRHANRTGMIHAKEYVALDESDTIAGQGNVDFRAIINLAIHNRWPIVVEYEGDQAPQVVRESGQYLQRLLQSELESHPEPPQEPEL